MIKRIVLFLGCLSLLVGLAWLAESEGAGKVEYRAVEAWLKLPEGFRFAGVTAVDVDKDDNLYVFHRGKQPIAVFDRTGKFLRSWGDDLIKTAHGLRLDPEGNIWTTDLATHLAIKFDPNGKVLLTLGTKDKSGTTRDTFNKPADVAVSPSGDVYVADGYGNSRVVKFSADGKYVLEWGTKGKAIGEFRIPHAIFVDKKGKVYVGDRENDRVQVFNPDGKFLEQWPDTGAPFGLYLHGQKNVLLADGRGDLVRVLDARGKVQDIFGKRGTEAGQFRTAHGICGDSQGALYVTEVEGERVQKFVKKSRHMSTEILHVDPAAPDPEAIRRGAAVLRGGGLVAFPTETVYGLGACALDADAVRRIFEAKGRPPNNPVIVHIAHPEDARRLVADWPDVAERLAQKFWPGPLTLVLPRRAVVPDVVTAGGPTVALRIPRHPVALALLEACGVPLAAPSANRSGAISPTCGEHVLRGMAGRVDLLLDASATPGGLESTVLDVSVHPPRLLRPGLVALAELEAVVGTVSAANELIGSDARRVRAGVLLARHYAPRTPLELVAGSGRGRALELARAGLRVGWLALGTEAELPDVVQVAMPVDASEYAARLYAVLHELDDRGLDRIVVTAPPEKGLWQAIHDRLRRAAAPA